MEAAGRPKVWTTGRKLVGNLAPLVIGAPFFALAVVNYRKDGLSALTIGALVAAPIIVWLAINLLGQGPNAMLKELMGKRLHDDRGFVRLSKHFVGFARPKFTSLLDPHEDVGYLILHPDRLEFFGGEVQLELGREAIEEIRYRANIHTWIGLGRWISIEGKVEDESIRMLVEPRERQTILGNRRYSARLRGELIAWLKEMEPQAEARDPMSTASDED